MVEDHWSVCECVWGEMDKSFQRYGPVPGQAAKASWEKPDKVLGPTTGAFPFHSEDEDRFTGPVL